jgi:hypothetical protein
MRSLALLLIVVTAVPVRAEESEIEKRAHAHYEAGRALYSLGNYEEALREFLSGYQIVPRPKFLLNLAQTFRKLDRLAEARGMYLRYLDEETAPDRDIQRPKVMALVHEIDQELAARPPRPPPPAPPAPQQVEAAPSAAAPPATVTATPPPKKSFIRRHWWIIPTTLVVAGGVAVGIYFGVRPTVNCSAAPLGCIDAQSGR